MSADSQRREGEERSPSRLTAPYGGGRWTTVDPWKTVRLTVAIGRRLPYWVAEVSRRASASLTRQWSGRKLPPVVSEAYDRAHFWSRTQTTWHLRLTRFRYKRRADRELQRPGSGHAYTIVMRQLAAVEHVLADREKR